MRPTPHIALLLGLLLGLLPGGGCASSARASGPDVMGFTLSILETRPGGSYALYLVARDGTLSFAGGLDAINGTPSWSGPLTADERARLQALIEEGRWRSASLPSPGVPEGTTYQIRMDWDDGHCVHKIKGAPPTVQEAVALLATAAERRNAAFIRSLPEPGEQP